YLDMDTGIIYRKASLDDVPYIADIWNQGIDSGNATFEIKKRDPVWTSDWLVKRDPRYVVLVAGNRNNILGWLSLNPFSSREAYRFVADISIYVENSYHGRGIGSGLLDHGIIEAKINGFHKLVLTMFRDNEIARKLYISRGFSTVGIMHEQGILNNKWIDTEIMEKIL
ncbi:N-acetyltransferase family protein, partial [Ferroplasma acidiphilum]